MSELKGKEELIAELTKKYEKLLQAKMNLEETIEEFNQLSDKKIEEFRDNINEIQGSTYVKKTSSFDVDDIINEYSNKQLKSQEQIERDYNDAIESINNSRTNKQSDSFDELKIKKDENEPKNANKNKVLKNLLSKAIANAKEFLIEALDNIDEASEQINTANNTLNQVISINLNDINDLQPIHDENEKIEDVLEIGQNDAVYVPEDTTNTPSDNNDINENADTEETLETINVESKANDDIEVLDELPKIEENNEPVIEELPDHKVQKLETIEDFEAEIAKDRATLKQIVYLKSLERGKSKAYSHYNYIIDEINERINRHLAEIERLKQEAKVKEEAKTDIVEGNSNKEEIIDTIETVESKENPEAKKEEETVEAVSDKDISDTDNNDEEKNIEPLDDEFVKDLGIRIASSDTEITDEDNVKESNVSLLENYYNNVNKLIKTIDKLELINKDKMRIESEISKRAENPKVAKNNLKEYEENGLQFATYKNSLSDLDNRISNLMTRMSSVTNNEEYTDEFNKLQKEYYELENEIRNFLQTILKNDEKELISVNNRIKLLKKDKKDSKNKAELVFLKDKKKSLKKEIRTISFYKNNNILMSRIIAGLIGTSILATSIIAFASCAKNAHNDKDELDDVITTTTYDNDDIYTTSIETEIPLTTTTLFTTMPESTTVLETTTIPTTTTSETTTILETTTISTTTTPETNKGTTTAEETEYFNDEEEVEKVLENLESYNNYNNTYRNEYTMITNHYGVSNEYAIELVNRAYNIQDAGFYIDASIDDIVLLLIRVDNGELMVFDSQGINDNINEVTTAFITGTTNNDDIRAIKALPYFVSSNSTTREWLIDYTNILVDILNNPNNSSYKLNAINYLYSLADYIKGMYFGGRFVSQEEYTAATTFYTMYNSFVVSTEALLYDESVVNSYNEVLDTLDSLFQDVYEIVCGNTVLVLAPTEGHYIEEETEYVR